MFLSGIRMDRPGRRKVGLALLEHLSFAPARVFFGRDGYGPLRLGPGKRGFSLVFSPWTDGNSASRRVGWQVTSRLTQLDRRGRILAPPKTIERR